MEMSAFSTFDPITTLLGFNLHGKHRVGPRACLVIKSRPDMSALRPFPQNLHCLVTMTYGFL